LLLRPRTSISTKLSPGVLADHDATSSLKGNDDIDQGAVQRALS
jgi:hypothetical protein